MIDRIGAGAFLCSIYARARWSDMRYIHHIKYDGFKRNATMDLHTAEHKTSMAGLRREQFLPLVIPSEGIVHGDWLGTFIKLCHEQGTCWEQVPVGPLLPAPKVNGGWCMRPLSTGEAANWLRKLLQGCRGVDSIRAHSMKVTLCVWAARAGFNKEHWATLSHHATALNGSDVVYSRELQTGAIRKLQMLLKKIVSVSTLRQPTSHLMKSPHRLNLGMLAMSEHQFLMRGHHQHQCLLQHLRQYFNRMTCSARLNTT